jgi:hypothetical protein
MQIFDTLGKIVLRGSVWISNVHTHREKLRVLREREKKDFLYLLWLNQIQKIFEVIFADRMRNMGEG